MREFLLSHFPPFDLPGTVVSVVAGDREGEGVVAVEGFGDVRVSFRYAVDPEVVPRLVPGDAVNLHYESYADGNAESLGSRRNAWIQDRAGRYVWGFDVHRNSYAIPYLRGISGLPTSPRCIDRLDTGFGEYLYGGSDLLVQMRDGAETLARLGEVTTVLGPAGEVGRLQVAKVFELPFECHDGPSARNLVELAFSVIVPGPEGPVCAGEGDCPEEEYCERANGGCGTPGRCVQRPASCPGGLPVCACDGQVYRSMCAANQAGVDVAPDGPECPGVYKCGTFACSQGSEACVRNHWVAIPHCASLDEEPCAARDCSCVEGDRFWKGCTCTEPAPGRFEVTCSGDGRPS